MMPSTAPKTEFGLTAVEASQKIDRDAAVNRENDVRRLLCFPKFTKYVPEARRLLEVDWAPEPGKGMREASKDHWPVVPRGALPVSRESVSLMTGAPPGTPLIGVVWFKRYDGRRPVEPEIVLHPSQSTGKFLERGILVSQTYNWNHTDRSRPETGSLKALAAARTAASAARRDHIDAFLARGRVLVNARVNNRLAPDFVTWEDAGNTSHTKLARLIAQGGIGDELRRLLEARDCISGDGVPDLQKAGLIIGFAVLCGGKYSRNKYTFTSRSSNTHSFSPTPKLSDAPPPPPATPGKLQASAAIAALVARQTGAGGPGPAGLGGPVHRAVEITTPTEAWCSCIMRSIDAVFPGYGKGLVEPNWWLVPGA
jgi:hypothetical protein